MSWLECSVPFEDGAVSIILNASAAADCEDEDVASLLQYISGNQPQKDDALARDLDRAIERAFEDERWRQEVLTVEEDNAIELRRAKKRAAAEGRAEGIAEGRAEGIAEGKQEVLRELKRMRESGATFDEAIEALSK